jgi:hypothetical protein
LVMYVKREGREERRRMREENEERGEGERR